MGEELKDELGCTLGSWNILATGKRSVRTHSGLGTPLQIHPIEHKFCKELGLAPNPPDSDLDVCCRMMMMMMMMICTYIYIDYLFKQSNSSGDPPGTCG